MNHQSEGQPFYRRWQYRSVTAALGILLIVSGTFVILQTDDFDIVSFAVGVILFLFGCNACYGAYKAKLSWLSKIGPLP